MQAKNFSNYEVDIENGTIYSYVSNSTIGHLNGDGYYCTTIYDDDGKRTTIRHHRFIWEVVNGTIPEGYEIHHKDKNRTNNSINNLELIECGTHKRNHFKGINNPMYGKSNPQAVAIGKSRSKPVACYTMDNTLVKTYPSTRAVAIDGFSPANVSHCCNGDYATHKGYKWSFVGC